jgi:hypothetical protein
MNLRLSEELVQRYEIVSCLIYTKCAISRRKNARGTDKRTKVASHAFPSYIHSIVRVSGYRQSLEGVSHLSRDGGKDHSHTM